MEGLAFVGAFLIIWVILMLVLVAYSITVYVMGSLGLYQIAKRRGIHNPWLAWLPVGNAWILGSVSDHYQYIARGKERSYRKVLMWLEVGLYCLSVVMSVISMASSFSTVLGAAMESEAVAMSGAMGVLGATMVLSLVVSGVSIVYSVFSFICYYDVFRSCKPQNAVLFLVLGILLGITPFLVFACRKADEGMPPKIRSTNG